jgi:hypothetical protein
VTMTGVSTAIITDNSTAGAGAGFNGNITGLTTVTLTSLGSPGGLVNLGTVGPGLNTALTTVNINASQILTADMTAAALAGAPSATINVSGGLGGAGLALNPVGVTTGYSALTINSAGPGGATDNVLGLFTTATNTATITVTGAEAITFVGDASATYALNIDNLHTFNANSSTAPNTPDTGGVTATFTNPDGLGHVDVTGGSGVNTFNFDDVTTGALAGTAGFTTMTVVDGGTGGLNTNTLGIEANTGAILLTGVGANITDIQTVVHTTDGVATGALTADLSQLGSATTFNLAGDYGAQTVNVTNITNAHTVEYSGSDAFLTLAHTTPLGGNSTIAFEMDGTGPGPLDLPELTVATGLVSLNIQSTGTASDNVIDNVSNIADNVNITGGTHLTFGSEAAPYTFTGTAVSGAVINASLGAGDTGGVTAWLGEVFVPNFPNPTQTFIGGAGNDTVHLLNFEGTVVDFSKGGNDIVNFTQPRDAGDGQLSNTPATDGSPELYNSVVGWSTANDTIQITNGGLMNNLQFTNGGFVPGGAATAILDFNTGSIANGSTVPDNWIKIDTPTTATGATANQGFQSAIGAAGQITTSAANESYLASFYDSTHGQAVFVTAASDAADHITNATTVDVIGLIKMTATDYANLTTASVHYV